MTDEIASDRADFYLCLARAFLTPREEAAWDAMRELLPADLEELDQVLGYGIIDQLAAYRTEVSRVGSAEVLLRTYSSLFLAPPVPAHINTAVYLDGTIGGGSVAEMEQAYRACGVERAEDFRDLSDHLGVQLEFVAYLYAREAAGKATGQETRLPLKGGHFLHGFVDRWLPGFISDLEQAAGERELQANPYLPLARILERAVARDAVPHPDAKPRSRAERAMDKARAKHAEKGVNEEDLRKIEAILKEKGLSTDHLSVPVGQRDATQGWQAKVPPSPRRKMEG
ncbi:MAG TPA: molecular chaperone TorD family protein [Burkholderiales bacterium]|nr:molecular chaperone TorD family protein [Burkholderiales bacterium]